MIVGLLLLAGTATAQTDKHWVSERVLSNGTPQHGHNRLDDFASFRYPGQNGFWTESGQYYRAGSGIEKDPYYKGSLPADAARLLEERANKSSHVN